MTERTDIRAPTIDHVLPGRAKVESDPPAAHGRDRDAQWGRSLLDLAGEPLLQGALPTEQASPEESLAMLSSVAELQHNLKEQLALTREKIRTTESDAEKVCRAVANSMLVKTALYGEDPNWGRILSAIGYSGADIDEDRVTIYLNGSRLYSKGKGIDKERVKSNLLSKEEITIRIDLGLGKKTAGFITSDLTEKYIQINAHYET